MPIAFPKSEVHRAPCTAGSRVVICTARIASAGFIGRIETTSGPWKRPVRCVSIFVRTSAHCGQVDGGAPDVGGSSGFSNEN